MEKRRKEYLENGDQVVLLNDGYVSYDVRAGYVGTVADDGRTPGIVLVDFYNPFSGDIIRAQVPVRRDDFRVLGVDPEEDWITNDAFRTQFLNDVKAERGEAAVDKYRHNAYVELMDDVVLLSDDYIAYGVRAGYIGQAVDTVMRWSGHILVDFENPVTGENIAMHVPVKKEDFRVLGDTKADRKLSEEYWALFLRDEKPSKL